MILHVKQHPSPAHLADYYFAEGGQEIPADRVAMTREEFAAWKASEIESGWSPVYPPDPPPVEPEPPEIEGVPKLTIKRRLGAKWATLRAIIATLPEDTQDEWNLAQVIEADDPIFVANAAFLQAALDLTEEEFAALLTP